MQASSDAIHIGNIHRTPSLIRSECPAFNDSHIDVKLVTDNSLERIHARLTRLGYESL
ncbi:MAG: hypothetical protein ACI9AP_000710 [Flavobacteriales bacterium]|jgi:hypothetical protein